MKLRHKNVFFNTEEGGGGGEQQKSPEDIQNEISQVIDDTLLVDDIGIQPAIKSDEHVFDDPNKVIVEPKKDPPPPNPEPITFTYNPIWDKIKTDYEKQIGEGTFNMPESLSAENEHEMLLEFVKNNVEPDISDFHPAAQELIKLSKQEDFDFNKWLEEKSQNNSYQKLSDEDFYRNHLKNYNEANKKGWSDDDIDNHITEKVKDKIAFSSEIAGLRGQYDEYNAKVLEDQNKANIETNTKQLDAIIEKRNKSVSELIERNKSVDSFYGVTFGEAELKEFHTWLPDMLKIDKETGSHPLADYLRSDDNLIKIAAIIYKTEKGMKDYLSDLKQGIKSDLLAKLRITPNIDSGTITRQPGLPDDKKLED